MLFKYRHETLLNNVTQFSPMKTWRILNNENMILGIIDRYLLVTIQIQVIVIYDKHKRAYIIMIRILLCLWLQMVCHNKKLLNENADIAVTLYYKFIKFIY